MEQARPTKPLATSAPRQRGQSLPEFLIVVPVFLFLLLMIFQAVLIYRAKTTLDYAALQAARMGAVSGADEGKMKQGLTNGLVPLYTTSAGPTGLTKAYGKASFDLISNSEIVVISPTKEAWEEFKERQYDGREALPNDNLAFRPTTIGSSGVNVQDANILKIRVRYHYPLIVPFVDRVLRGDSDYVRSSGFFDPANVDMRPPILGNYFRIPLQSTAIVRMQTPIYDSSVLRNADGTPPETPPGGPGGPGDPGGPGGPGDPGGPGGPGDPGGPGPGDPGPGDPGPGDPDPGDPEDPICL